MKKRVLLVIGLYLCSMTVLGFAKDQTWDGWISDSKCGAKGANAAHEACAKKCVASGEKPVFVTDKDQKVVPVDNPSPARSSRTSRAGHRQHDRRRLAARRQRENALAKGWHRRRDERYALRCAVSEKQ